MAQFLSPEWLIELEEAARSHERLAELTGDTRLVIEQRVVPGDDGTGADAPGFVYHLALDHGTVSVAEGPAADPTVTFTQTPELARAIATGEESAQRAFMTGDLRVGGNLQELLIHQQVLAELGDVFAQVRARTDFDVTIGS